MLYTYVPFHIYMPFKRGDDRGIDNYGKIKNLGFPYIRVGALQISQADSLSVGRPRQFIIILIDVHNILIIIDRL